MADQLKDSNDRSNDSQLRMPRGVLIASAILLVITAAGLGYLVLSFKQATEAAHENLVETQRRDTLILSSYRTVLQYLARVPVQPQATAGQRAYPANSKLLSELHQQRQAYAETLAGEEEKDSARLFSIADQFFKNADLLIEAASAPLVTTVSGENVTVEKSELYGQRFRELANSFEELESLEHEIHGEILSRSEGELQRIAVRWFIASLLLFGFFGLTMSVIVRLGITGRPESQTVQTLLEYSTSPVLVLNNQGITTYVNPAFERWIGAERSGLVGSEAFRQSYRPDTGTQGAELWNEAKRELENGRGWSADVEITNPSGAKLYCSVVLSPVLDKERTLVECIAIHTDQTERHEFARRIEETQRQYRNIVESSLDGIVVVQEGHLVYANPTAVNIFGYTSAEEMKMVNFTDTVAPSSRPFLSLRPEGRAVGDEILKNYELRGLTKQGRMIDLEANARVIEWNNQTAVQASFRDITERKMLEREQALWLWEQETLSEIDRKLVGVVDLQRILEAILQQTLNLTRAHWAGVIMIDEQTLQAQWKVMRGNNTPMSSEIVHARGTLLNVFETKEPLVVQEYGTNGNSNILPVADLKDEKIVSSIWLPLVVEGRGRGLLAVGFRNYHDFAGREIRLLISLAEKNSIALANAELYENLIEREKELELLSGARVQAQEEERRRIAREIHDGLGQMLTAIKFNLEILEDNIATGDEERKRIDDMKSLLDSVMREAREISYNLMPSVLVDFGLAPALQLLCEQFSRRRDIKILFHAHGLTERLEPTIEIGLYRIAQEALNNIAKHASATEVNVQIVRHQNGINLTIEDNGKGMEQRPKQLRLQDRVGMGLVSMRERASSFNATLTIDSTPGRGTLVTVDTPLLEHAPHGKNPNPVS